MVSKIQALRGECLEILKSKNSLEKFQSDISFKEFNKAELKQFVELCDNRLELSKTFLNITIWIMGIIITALLISFSISFGKDISNLEKSSISVVSLLFLALGLTGTILYRRHISHIRGWASFKEMALMHCPDKLNK